MFSQLLPTTNSPPNWYVFQIKSNRYRIKSRNLDSFCKFFIFIICWIIETFLHWNHLKWNENFFLFSIDYISIFISGTNWRFTCLRSNVEPACPTMTGWVRKTSTALATNLTTTATVLQHSTCPVDLYLFSSVIFFSSFNYELLIRTNNNICQWYFHFQKSFFVPYFNEKLKIRTKTRGDKLMKMKSRCPGLQQLLKNIDSKFLIKNI